MGYKTNYCIYVHAYHHPEVDRICFFFKNKSLVRMMYGCVSVCVYIYIDCTITCACHVKHNIYIYITDDIKTSDISCI